MSEEKSGTKSIAHGGIDFTFLYYCKAENKEIRLFPQVPVGTGQHRDYDINTHMHTEASNLYYMWDLF